MAEAVFQKMIDEEGLGDEIKVDSAGTGSWHVGEMAHRGTRRVLEEHGIQYSGRARQIASDDLNPDTYIIAMAQNNIDELERRFGTHPRLFRLLEFVEDAEVLDVPDPYYTGNFEYVYQLVEEGCRGLLDYIREQEGL